MNLHPTIIIGAGPAGLAAAYELTGRHDRPFVVEKGSKVGGLARTETYKGYHFDLGGHRFFTKIDEIDKLWQGILGRDFLKVPRLSRIYYNGRFLNYPLDIINVLSNLGIIESILIISSYLKEKLHPSPEAKNFEQRVVNCFGRRLYERFFKSYTEKVWGIPCHMITADLAVQRIRRLSLISAVSDALFGVNSFKTLIKSFHYPVLGPGMMWQRFQEEIENGGGRILLNSEVVALKCMTNRIVSIQYKDGNSTRELTAGHIISTMPITGLITLLEPSAPREVVEAARKLTYRAFILVGLIVNKTDLFPDQWIYIHSNDVKVGRIQNFKNWSAAMVPDSGKTCIGMEYFCNDNDEFWAMPNSRLMDIASRELSELGLVDTDDIIDMFVVRHPSAYPIYEHDYDKHLKVIREFLGTIDNLQTIGRNGMHRYNNMDHSMYTGLLAARNILGANHELWEVNEEEEYLEDEKRSKAIQPARERFLAKTFARMDKPAFAVATGTVSGLILFLATIWLIIKGGEVMGPNLRLLSQYFIGYTVTVKGAFIAFGYSFLWGFLFGWLFAYLRNLLLAYYVYRTKKKAEVLSLKDFIDNF